VTFYGMDFSFCLLEGFIKSISVDFNNKLHSMFVFGIGFCTGFYYFLTGLEIKGVCLFSFTGVFFTG